MWVNYRERLNPRRADPPTAFPSPHPAALRLPFSPVTVRRHHHFSESDPSRKKCPAFHRLDQSHSVRSIVTWVTAYAFWNKLGSNQQLNRPVHEYKTLIRIICFAISNQFTILQVLCMRVPCVNFFFFFLFIHSVVITN